MSRDHEIENQAFLLLSNLRNGKIRHIFGLKTSPQSQNNLQIIRFAEKAISAFFAENFKTFRINKQTNTTSEMTEIWKANFRTAINFLKSIHNEENIQKLVFKFANKSNLTTILLSSISDLILVSKSLRLSNLQILLFLAEEMTRFKVSLIRCGKKSISSFS